MATQRVARTGLRGQVNTEPPRARIRLRARRAGGLSVGCGGMTRSTYPKTRRLDLVEELHGFRIADPYRWLEDAAAPETAAWLDAQDVLVRGHLGELAG